MLGGTSKSSQFEILTIAPDSCLQIKGRVSVKTVVLSVLGGLSQSSQFEILNSNPRQLSTN